LEKTMIDATTRRRLAVVLKMANAAGDKEPVALTWQDARLLIKWLGEDGKLRVEAGAVTVDPCDDVVHSAIATPECPGGRNDTGDWSKVTCPDCLKAITATD
jgi:hypothetical protein